MLSVLLFLLLEVAAVTPQQAASPPPQATTTATITGSVTDVSVAAIPGATITVKKGTETIRIISVDERGEYRITGLPPGTYAVTVSAPGFGDFNSPVITLNAGGTERIDATLAPAQVVAEVKVEAQAAGRVETETAQLSGTLTTKEITAIGLNGRNFTQLISLAPGVSNQTGQDEALVGVKGSVNYSVNGGRVEYNSYDVDGADVLNASINGSHSTLIVYPSLDAIGELQVLTSNYGAMYGRSASGTILVTTKTGGADFHGSGYFFARNNIFNSRNFFDLTSHAPLYRKYDLGFTLGGPLYIPNHYNTNKSRTFFFVSEEWRHEREPVNFNQAVPSAAQRDCTTAANPNPFCQQPAFGGPQVFGDFSDVCPQTLGAQAGITAGTQEIFQRNNPKDLNTYYPDCPGRPFGNQQFLTFPGNLVPVDAISKALLDTNLIPLPNSRSGCNGVACYVAAVSPPTRWREDLIRLDHNITASERLTFRFIHDSWDTTVPVPQWGYITNSFPTVQNRFKGPGVTFVARLTSTFGSRLVNDLAFNFSRAHITLSDVPGPGVSSLARPKLLDAPPCLAPTPTTPCGLGYIFQNGFGDKIPGIIIGGTNSVYGGRGFAVDSGYMPWDFVNPNLTFRDDAAWVLGKHTLKLGVLAVWAHRRQGNTPVGANTGALQGIIRFTNINNRNTTGNAFADFLTPNIQSYQQDSAQGTYRNNYRIIEPYVQDDWKVSRRLTLNLGLRYSLFGLYHEKSFFSNNWVPSEFQSSLASEVNVQPFFGNLRFAANNASVPLDLDNLDPHLTNGLVRCGVSNYSNGKRVPPGCMTSRFANPAPRVGLAWDIFGDGKVSIRAGYGLFYHHGTGNEANSGSLEGSPGNASAGGVVDMTHFFPLSWGCIGNAGTGCPPGGTFPINATAIPTRNRWPYVQQWSLSAQSELPWKLLGTVAYVGSKGTNLTAELQINQLLPVNQSGNPFPNHQPINNTVCEGFSQGVFIVNGQQVFAGQPGYTNLLAACTGVVLQIPTPNALRTPGAAIAPGFGQIFSLQNIARSNYHALQVSFRRTETPLNLGVSYTYSHSIDDSSDRTQSTFINAYQFAQNRASSDFDQRHLLSINYVYQLSFYRVLDSFLKWQKRSPDDPAPAGFAHEGRLKKFLDQWEVSGVTLFSTGTPFSAINGGSSNGVSSLDNAGVAASPDPGSYPDVVRNAEVLFSPKVSPGTSTVIVPFAGNGLSFGPIVGNPLQFVAPRGLTYGNAGRNALNNPSRLNFDLALLKTANFHTKYTFQFRAEVFNLFNHTQFRIYDPSNPGNRGNNVVTCFGGGEIDPASGFPTGVYSTAGDASCVAGAVNAKGIPVTAGSSFLHPVNAHRPRTFQFGVKFLF